MNLTFDVSKAIVDKWNTISGYSGKLSQAQGDSSKTSPYGVFYITEQQQSNFGNGLTIYNLQFNLHTRDTDTMSGLIDFTNKVKDTFYKNTLSGSGSGYTWQTGHIQQASPNVYFRGDRNYWQATLSYNFFVNI